MNIIENNPFRIAGIFANSNEKELQKNKSKISRYASVGKDMSFDVDFPFFVKSAEMKKICKMPFPNYNKVKIKSIMACSGF